MDLHGTQKAKMYIYVESILSLVSSIYNVFFHFLFYLNLKRIDLGLVVQCTLGYLYITCANTPNSNCVFYLHLFIGKAVRIPDHPDYVPSIFVYTQNDQKKHEKKMSRFKAVKKRNHIADEMIAANKRMKQTVVEQTEFDDLSQPGDSDSPMSQTTAASFEIIDSITVDENQKTNEEFEKHLLAENVCLRKERDDALSKLKSLEAKFLSYNSLRSQPKKFNYYTGIDVDKFDAVFRFMEGSLPRKSKYKMDFKDQLLMTLVKLRLNIQFENLADQFQSTKSTLHSIFWKWVDLLFSKLSFLIRWPDHDASIRTLPHVFRQYFPRLTGIIDCTEIFIDRPKNLKARAQVYSNYKKHSTVKFLIACTPLGAVSFISKAWGGRVSDVELVKNSGFISSKLHFPGDQILADRGFTLVDEFAAGCGVQLIIPSFTKGKKQLSAKEVETTRQIASIRIHVERVIGLIKNRYLILTGPIPITMVQSIFDEANKTGTSSIDKLFTVCACLVNLGDGIVYKE